MIIHFQCQRCHQWTPYTPGLDDTEFCSECSKTVDWKTRRAIISRAVNR